MSYSNRWSFYVWFCHYSIVFYMWFVDFIVLWLIYFKTFSKSPFHLKSTVCDDYPDILPSRWNFLLNRQRNLLICVWIVLWAISMTTRSEGLIVFKCKFVFRHTLTRIVDVKLFFLFLTLVSFTESNPFTNLFYSVGVVLYDKLSFFIAR